MDLLKNLQVFFLPLPQHPCRFSQAPLVPAQHILANLRINARPRLLENCFDHLTTGGELGLALAVETDEI